MGDIYPRHQRRIIAAAIGVGYEKERGWVSVGSFFLEKDKDRIKGKVPGNDGIHRSLNPKGTYVGSGIKNVVNGKKKRHDIRSVLVDFFQKIAFVKCF